MNNDPATFRRRLSSGEKLIGTFVKTPGGHATEIGLRPAAGQPAMHERDTHQRARSASRKARRLYPTCVGWSARARSSAARAPPTSPARARISASRA